jgi:hypothetical protein
MLTHERTRGGEPPAPVNDQHGLDVSVRAIELEMCAIRFDRHRHVISAPGAGREAKENDKRPNT